MCEGDNHWAVFDFFDISSDGKDNLTNYDDAVRSKAMVDVADFVSVVIRCMIDLEGTEKEFAHVPNFRTIGLFLKGELTILNVVRWNSISMLIRKGEFDDIVATDLNIVK